MKENATLCIHDEFLLKALESARRAAVDVARSHGYISLQTARAAENALEEIRALVGALSDLSVLGETDGERLRETA